MTSNKSSAQLHVTFDVRVKHGGSFTYDEILRKVFDIFIISFGNFVCITCSFKKGTIRFIQKLLLL